MSESMMDWGEGVPATGSYDPDFMLIGQAPSSRRPQWAELQPFGAASYEVVSKIKDGLEATGETMYFTNLVKIPHPPMKKFKVAEWRPHLPLMLREIRTIRPKRILTIGDLPSKAIIRDFKNMRADHGTFFPMDFGYGEVMVVPTYHFSVFRDQPKLLARDLERFFTLEPKWLEYQLFEDDDEFIDIIRDLPKSSRLVVDIETTGVKLGHSEITMIGVLPEFNKKGLVWVRPSPRALNRFFFYVRQHHLRVLGHNLTFDLSMIFNQMDIFLPPQDMSSIRVDDTMVLAHINGEEVLGLKHLTTVHTDRPGPHGMGGPESPAYLAEDLASTRDLFRKTETTGYIQQIVSIAIPKLAYMRARGVFLNLERLETIGNDIEGRLRGLLEELPRDINWNSSQQITKVLLDAGVPLRKKTPTGQFSTSAKVLENLQTRATEGTQQEILLTRILSYRGLAKQYSGFIKGYRAEVDNEGYLHPNLKITGTRTGRFSCANPNLQQVPRLGPMKTMFQSRWNNGQYALVDLSQAELRVAALLSEDQVLMKSLASSDPHSTNASMLYSTPIENITSIQRKKSKAVMFGVLYGGSPQGLASRTKFSEDSIEEAMNLLKERFQGLTDWIDDVQQDALRELESVTLFGRHRSFERVMREEGMGGVMRKAVNTPIQSLASDINLLILLNIIEQLEDFRLQSYPLFMVHDSILLEVYPGEETQLADVVKRAYTGLWKSPLGKLPLFEKMPIKGELVMGQTWASVESTNELYNPTLEVECQSH